MVSEPAPPAPAYTAEAVTAMLREVERIDRQRIPFHAIERCVHDLRTLSGGMHAFANEVNEWLNSFQGEDER